MADFQNRKSENIDVSGPHCGPDVRLSAEQRLIKSSLFSETFSQQKRWVGRYMVLWRRSGEGAALRLGVVTSKKVNNRANKRNRVRRRMREAYRRCRPYLSGDFDVLLIGRRAAINAEWADIVRELLKLAERAELLSRETRKQAEQEILTNGS